MTAKTGLGVQYYSSLPIIYIYIYIIILYYIILYYYIYICIYIYVYRRYIICTSRHCTFQRSDLTGQLEHKLSAVPV